MNNDELNELQNELSQLRHACEFALQAMELMMVKPGEWFDVYQDEDGRDITETLNHALLMLRRVTGEEDKEGAKMANDKAALLRQVEEQLVNLWPHIKPGYDWLAADSDGDGKFDWYCYNYRPSQQTSNEGREWSFEDDCLLLYGLHITIPDGLEWHDLIFERPK